MKTIKYSLKQFLFLLLFIGLMGTGSIVITPRHHVSAASLSQFNPGRIIDDSVFTNQNSMNTTDIQSFLNSKVSNCDTNGTQVASEYGSKLTHAQYAASRGWQPPPYNCLENYNENGISSAQIIYNLSQQYRINPQVLLVLLQKESGLVTDNWPSSTQYLTATGYGCPDTSACQSQYYGLTNQLTHSASMFRSILDANASWYSTYVIGSNFVLYNPVRSCGGTTLNIVNHATQALYDYTPYQPNTAALAAGYGTGDSCSAYGNRNFYLYFNDWFGSTTVANLEGCNEATNTVRACVWEMYNPSNLKQFLTSSVSTRDELFTNQGYQYVGKAFYGNVVSQQGNIPVYRASISGGGSFTTTSQLEYNNLIASGYTGNGIDFYADPAWSNSGYPVYRLYNSTTFAHYWTTSPQERQTYLQSGYNNEGIAFVSISPASQATAPPLGKMLVYRFYIPQTYSHFWTTDVYERDKMIIAGYNYEGVAWYSSTSTSDKPVYRLFSALINQHVYTTDLNEVTTLTSSRDWTDEGVSQYVSLVATTKPIYRIYAPSLGVHLYTADAYERSQLVGSGRWNDEGIAWYQP